MQSAIQALLVTGGHAFVSEPFFQMIDAMDQTASGSPIHWTHAEQPKAQAFFHPERAAEFDVIVLYDMPGVTFTGSNPPFAVYDPPAQYTDDFKALVEAGKGFVFLHHAIAGWPTWPDYAELIGGRFHFLPGQLGGRDYPGSGYRFDVDHTIDVVDPTHPVVADLEPAFSMTDEVYLYPVLEDDVVPLLRSRFPFNRQNFQMGGVGFEAHPDGSDLVGWVKASGASPITYLQFGHEPPAYQNPNYRRLITNAVEWSASPESHEWARNRVASGSLM